MPATYDLHAVFDMTRDNTYCMECGQSDSLAAFRGESFTVTCRNGAMVVENLAGQRCSACGEVFFDEASAATYAAASDALVTNARQNVAAHLRRVRKKLGLTQRAAAELTGGGHNAFSRYENGQATPVAAVVNLFTLLDHHPELVHELRVPQRQVTRP